MPQIPAGWEETTLGEVADVGNGYAFKSSDLGEKADNTFPVFKMGNIERGGGLKITGKEDYYCGNIEIDKRFFTQKHDILISMTDMHASMELLGYSARIKNEKFVVNQRVGIIRPIVGKINPIYLSYFMNTKFYINRLRTTANSGVQVNLTTAGIKNSLIHLPPLPEQKAIAAVLSSFDDKIDLLRAENQTLEQMGQELFKERFGKWKVGDELPEGWRVGKLGEMIDFLNGFAYKSSDFVESGKYKLVTIANVQDGNFIVNTKDSLDSIPEKMPDYCLLNTGDILLSLTGNVGRVCLVIGENYFLNQRVAKIRSKNSFDYGFSYFYFRQKHMITLLESISVGTAQQNLSPIKTANLDILIPSREVLDSFGEKANVLVRKIVKNLEQIQPLSATRDQLLPKLMSGEVRVKF